MVVSLIHAHFSCLVLKNIIREAWLEVIPADQKQQILQILVANLGNTTYFIRTSIVYSSWQCYRIRLGCSR